jgi:long-subunit fatty acid transport protein
MKYIATASAALLASTAIASAGGVERSAQSMAILFEEGTYAELGFSYVDPDVSGALVASPTTTSGDMLESYTSVSLSYRQDITENLSFAFVIDQPIGADVSYPGGTSYPLRGSTGKITSTALSAYLRYEFPSNFSIYGGIRAVEADGKVSIPAVASYTLDASGSTELGYALGVAYERPDIALRVSLTYFSATDHRFSATETLGGAATATSFDTTIPQSINLEFQSGIDADTLVFGSIRWVDWSEFDITPTRFLGATNDPLVSYASDTITYTLGVGRRFNETWSGAFSVVHEPSNGDLTGNLGPTDGRTGVGLGLTWAAGNGLEISGGVQYAWIGDATSRTTGSGTPGTPFGSFTDNTLLAAGIRIGFQF